jgi:hypothetical protein
MQETITASRRRWPNVVAERIEVSDIINLREPETRANDQSTAGNTLLALANNECLAICILVQN